MTLHDTDILDLISEKEETFTKEILLLKSSLTSPMAIASLTDYVNGLNDLRNDFLKPVLTESKQEKITPSEHLADKYWYFQRT